MPVVRLHLFDQFAKRRRFDDGAAKVKVVISVITVGLEWPRVGALLDFEVRAIGFDDAGGDDLNAVVKVVDGECVHGIAASQSK